MVDDRVAAASISSRLTSKSRGPPYQGSAMSSALSGSPGPTRGASGSNERYIRMRSPTSTPAASGRPSTRRRSARACCAVMASTRSRRATSSRPTLRARCRSSTAYPRSSRAARARGSMPWPCSSSLTPVESTTTCPPSPAASNRSRRTTWAIGDRQMFPVHTVMTR
ncbi:hypothetical protein BJF88_08995 [Cellulosimicrobium sp. CUA-896]|nr:hypothetical protein BJF88_08995 [Cellulosimicrobium sp. CUA-896]